MCGIAGIVHLDGSPIRSRDLSAMAERIRHRGPDGEGVVFLSENPSSCRFFPTTNPPQLAEQYRAGFAHKRLSIIDLTESGAQPMTTADGRLWITYNGELYNYIELRRELGNCGRRFRTETDTEVLLAAYDEWGIECLDRFNGMWAFAIWDTGRRRLFIARDRFIEILTSSVRLRLRSDVPVGTCLSGGLDSSAVVCIARPWLEKGNQKTYSAVYDSSFIEDETRYIDEITRYIDVENYRVNPTAETLLEDMATMISSQDEPFGSTSQYAQYKVFQTARTHGTTVTLDGQGTDEELAGYHYMFPVHFAGLARRGKPLMAWRELSAYRSKTGAPYSSTILSTLAGFFSHRSMIRFANLYDPGRSVDWVSRDITGLAGTINAPEPSGIDDPLNRRLYELFTISSLPALLRYEDRNSMAWAVEARLPFLDYRLVSFLFSLPPEQKIRNGVTKYVMREALRGIVPESIRARTDKVGFSTPESSWYRSGMLGYMRTVLNDAVTRKRGLYDVERLSLLVEANASGRVDAGRALWRALNLELWFRRYID